MTYQDVLDDRGLVVERGSRDCESRWDAIESYLTGLPWGPRVLDLGAYAGYFSLRMADRFGAQVVAVDDWRDLRKVDHQNITTIHRRLTPSEVEALGEFDLVLALSVLHHIPEWRDMLDVLDRVTTGIMFVETPDPSEVLPKAVAHCVELHDAVVALGGDVIARTDGHRSTIKRNLWAI